MSDKEQEDSDNDVMSYFAAPKKKAIRRITPPRAASSSPELVHSSDSDAAAGRKPRQKIKKKKKHPVAHVPDLKIRRPHRDRDRTRSGSSKAKTDVVEVVEEEDDAARIERKKREFLAELAPIAPIRESQVEYIRKVVADHMASIVTSASIVDPIDDDIAIDNEISAPAVSRNNRSTLKSPPPGSSANRVDERVTINLRMVADPARREQGDSARAIARYEMKRVVRVNRRDPLSRMLGDLGERINRDPDQLVLQYQGGKIYYASVTPQQLGIAADAEVDMKCYEKFVWDKLNSVDEADPSTRAAEGDASDDDVQLLPSDKGKGKAQVITADIPPPRAPSPLPPSPAVPKIFLRLRGQWGEIKVGLQPHITASQILQSYAGRVNMRSELSRMHLVLDGETLDEDTAVADMDVESGDLVDVELR